VSRERVAEIVTYWAVYEREPRCKLPGGCEKRWQTISAR
jgi:hypothetical protein